MLTFTNRHILDGRTPVIPIELSGERNRGLALEARYRWPGIWDAINQALRDGTLAENAGRVLTWNARDGRTVIIAPACTGSQHPGASRVIQDLAIVTTSLKAIGPAVTKADATTVNLPPMLCHRNGTKFRTLAPWVLEAAEAHPSLDWILHWWPVAAFQTESTRAVFDRLGHRIDEQPRSTDDPPKPAPD